MPVTQTWIVHCDNPSGKCVSHSVQGRPNEEKNAVIGRAFSSFGYQQIKCLDDIGFAKYYLLCGECIKLGRYPK